jgi:hypothetical protein
LEAERRERSDVVARRSRRRIKRSNQVRLWRKSTSCSRISRSFFSSSIATLG